MVDVCNFLKVFLGDNKILYNRVLFTFSTIYILDGKFILELARSKDGEKGGWVSVPRKPFQRTSLGSSVGIATSTGTATTTTIITPSSVSTSATASPLAASSPAAHQISGTNAYPKNECSNSLSCKL